MPASNAVLLLLLSLNSSALAAPKSGYVSFPKGFKWCVATAAHQVEGGNDRNDWWDWESLPPVCTDQGCTCKIKGCEKSGRATDHWNRIAEDIRLLQDLGVQQYRLSIEWARIEPTEGTWDLGAVQHYRHEIAQLVAAGVEPLITLHHFTLPRWVRAHGGWVWPGAPEAFARFAVFALREIGPGVRDWVTFNEPMVHLSGGYVLGLTPPGIGPKAAPAPAPGEEPGHPFLGGAAPKKEDIERVIPPARGLLMAHALAYHRMHAEAAAVGKDLRIGMAHHLRAFDAKRRWSPLDRYVAGVIETLWNWVVPNALQDGVFEISIPTMLKHREVIPGLKGTYDFSGVNYYTRDIVSFVWDKGVSVKLETEVGTPRSDLEWEIYPEGIHRILRETYKRYDRKPILITENGLADRRDSKRIPFLKEHLGWVARAIQDGVRVEGYCHWSLLDNFEWVEGFAPRFGLYEVDYATFERKPRPSARFFSDLTRDNGFYR